MLARPSVGSANVTIMLGDQEFQLVPTLAAAQGISRLNGGIRGAIDAVIKIDLDTITSVIRFGMGPKAVREFGGDNLAEAVWRSGMTDSQGELAAKCIEYLSILTNGGRPVAKAATTEGGEEADPQNG